MVHRGGVDDHFRLDFCKSPRNRIQVGGLDIRVGQRGHGVAVVCESSDNIASELPVCSDNRNLHRQSAFAIALNFHAVFHGLKGRNVGIAGIVPVLKFVHIFDQVHHNGFQIVRGMEAQDIFRLLYADLVIPKVLNVLDDQADRNSQAILNRRL